MYGTDDIRILKYSNTPLISPGMNTGFIGEVIYLEGDSLVVFYCLSASEIWFIRVQILNY